MGDRFTWHKNDIPTPHRVEITTEHMLKDNGEPTGWFVEEIFKSRNGPRQEIRIRYLKKHFEVNEKTGKRKFLRVITTTKKAKAKTPKGARKECLDGYKNRKKINSDLVTHQELKAWKPKNKTKK